MDAFDADHLVGGDSGLLIGLDMQRAFADKRMIELGNLVSLRQIGVEIILAVEARPFVDLRIDRHAGAHRLADALAVRHRQHARHRGVDEAHLRIGFGPERRRGAREQLGVGGDLRMDLEADHDLPLAGFALDAIVRHLRSFLYPREGGDPVRGSARPLWAPAFAGAHR